MEQGRAEVARVPPWEAREEVLNKVAVAVFRAIGRNLVSDEAGLKVALSEAAIMLAEVASTL